MDDVKLDNWRKLVAPLEIFKEILENLLDGIFIVNSRKIFFANEAFAQMLGYTCDELIGQPVADIISPEDRDWVMERAEQRLRGETPPNLYQFNFINKDKTARVRVEIFVTVVHTSTGEAMTVGACKNLSNQRNLVRQLEDSERELKLIIENLPDVFYRTDAEGRITIISPSCVEALGYTQAEMIGRRMTDFYVNPEDRSVAIEKMLANPDSPTRIEAAMRHKNGETRWISANCYVRRDRKGTFIGIEGIARNATERRAMEEQLREAANHDTLTGLANRNYMGSEMIRAIARAKRTEQGIALFYLDLDGFKDINDTHGHHVGDMALCLVAKRLKGLFRESDLVARIGGDEFVVLLEGGPSSEKVAEIGNKIIESLSEPLKLEEVTAQLGVSIGVALYPSQAETWEDLLQHADKAMYQAKKDGKGRVVLHS